MRIYPLQPWERDYPRSVSSIRDYPLTNYPYSLHAGNSKLPLVGETVYPFAELEIGYPTSLVVSSVEYQLSGAGTWTEVSAGNYANAVDALRYVGIEVSTLSTTRGYLVQVSFTDANAPVLSGKVDVFSYLRLPDVRKCYSGQTIKPFANAVYAVDDTYITSAEYSVSGTSSVARTALMNPILVSGLHNTGTSISLIDTTQDFSGISIQVGDVVHVSTGATMTITGINTTINTGDTLSGSLSVGSFISGSNYLIRETIDKVAATRVWDYQFNTSGSYKMTLYVTDSGANESSDSILVQVG